MKTITAQEIINKRDQMSVAELRTITNKTKEKFGYIDFARIFETMGYVRAINDKYFDIN